MDLSHIREAWKLFDRVYLICCHKYNNRLAYIKNELQRVGIDNYFEMMDNPDPFLEFLQPKLPYRRRFQKNTFRCGYNHFRAISDAYFSGLQSVLLVEDDIVFLNDLTVLRNILLALPSDFDIALFDKTYAEGSRDTNSNYRWGRFDVFRSTGCYALSRKGMERFLHCVRRDLKNKSLKTIDQYWNKTDFHGLNRFAVFPNAAIQKAYEECSTVLEQRYYPSLLNHGCNFSEYDVKITYPIIDKMIAMRDHKTQVMTNIKKKSILEHKPWISNFKPKDEGKPKSHSSIIIPSRYSMMRKYGRLA